MSQYIGREALKLAVGVDDTTDDALLTSVTFRASSIVDGYLERIRPGYVGFASSSNVRTAVGSNTRSYDGTGTDTLFIDDAQSIASISVDTVAVSSNSWRLWPYNETPKRAVIYALPASSIRGLTQDRWTRGTANVVTTGYFGLDTVPNDVEQVSLAVGVTIWRRYQQGDFTAGGLSAQRFETDPEITAILHELDSWAVPTVLGAGSWDIG